MRFADFDIGGRTDSIRFFVIPAHPIHIRVFSTTGRMRSETCPMQAPRRRERRFHRAIFRRTVTQRETGRKANLLPAWPFHGGDEGIRTLGPHVANVMLSQLSYIPTGYARRSAERYFALLAGACQQPYTQRPRNMPICAPSGATTWAALPSCLPLCRAHGPMSQGDPQQDEGSVRDGSTTAHPSMNPLGVISKSRRRAPHRHPPPFQLASVTPRSGAGP